MAPVATTPPSNSEQPASSRFPRWLLGVGVIAVGATSALAARLIWEQTVLTWERGPQNIGFSLLHGSAGILILSPFVLLLWLGFAVPYSAWRLLKHQPLSRGSIATIMLAIGILWLLSIPYGFWQRLFVDRLASGPNAAKFFSYAAAMGDVATAKAFLDRGVPVDVRLYGRTALAGAATAGRVEVIAFLIAAGADLNATDTSGELPLALATAANHKEAAAYLAEHGAKVLHGTDEQKRKARDDMRAAVPYPPSVPTRPSEPGPK